jgi:general secretion pathway protein M
VIVAAVVFVLAVSQWLVRPLMNRRDRLVANIEKTELRLKELTQLEHTYYQVKADNAQVEQSMSRRKRDFTLFAFLENLAGKDGLKEQIEFMRPSVKALSDTHQEEQVEMRLDGVSLGRLVPYLYHIETATEKVQIKRLTIKPQQRNRALLEVNLVVITLGPREAPRPGGKKGTQSQSRRGA